MAKAFIVCMLFAACTFTLSLEVHQIHTKNQFHAKINGLLKATSNVKAEELKDKLTGKLDKDQTKQMVEKDLNKAKHALKKIAEDVADMLDVLNNKLKSKLSQNEINLLTRRWNNLNHIVKKKTKIINDLLSDSTCLIQKATFNHGWAKADTMFKNMLADVEINHSKCTVFSKACVKAYRYLKEDLHKFNHEKVDGSRKQLESLKESNCFSSPDERSIFNKKVLDLECRVEGMILNIQFTVKKLITNQLKAQKTIRQGFEKDISELEKDAHAETEKAVLEEILHTMKDVFQDSVELKQDFLIIYECVHNLKGWLLPEDYEECHRLTFRMYYDLGAHCVDVEEAKLKLTDRINILCIEAEIHEKKDKLLALKEGVDTEIPSLEAIRMDIELGEDGDTREIIDTCDIVTDRQADLKKIIKDIEKCNVTLVALRARLNKEVPEGTKFDELEEKLTAEDDKAKAHVVTAKKYSWYFSIFDKLYCIDHTPLTTPATPGEDKDHHVVFHHPSEL